MASRSSLRSINRSMKARPAAFSNNSGARIERLALPLRSQAEHLKSF